MAALSHAGPSCQHATTDLVLVFLAAVQPALPCKAALLCRYYLFISANFLTKAAALFPLQGRIDLRTPQNRFWLIVVKSNGRGLPLLPDRWELAPGWPGAGLFL